MKLGFTGTQRGMTDPQRIAFRKLLVELNPTEFHHGDCVGADYQADADAKMTEADVYAHPPTDSRLRAFCDRPTIVMPPKPYLKRNRDIVLYGVDGLIATPKDFSAPTSLRGQGTWTTIGYAKQAGRKVWTIFPDGRLIIEGPDA